MLHPVSQGRLSEARDRDNNINMSDYVIRYIISPQLRNMSSGQKVCISENSMKASLIDWIKKHSNCLDPNYLCRLRLRSVENFRTIFSQYRYEVAPNEKILH